MTWPVRFRHAATGLVVTALLAIPVIRTEATTPAGSLLQTNGTVKVGDPAPDFRGQGIDGKAVSLEAFRGKVLLLSFISPSCPACRELLAELRRMETDYHAAGFALLLVCADDPTSALNKAATTEIHRQAAGLGCLLPDPGSSVSDRYGVRMFPSQFLIDRGGKITKIHVGYIKNLDKLMAIPSLLAEDRQHESGK